MPQPLRLLRITAEAKGYMELNPVEQKQHAHVMIDLLGPEKLTAVVSLLEVMLDPVARALANASPDDEEISAEEEEAVAAAREWFKTNPGIPLEKVVAELGFTLEEVRNYQDPA